MQGPKSEIVEGVVLALRRSDTTNPQQGTYAHVYATHTLIGDHASCNQTASMQCFIVDSIDFHAFLPKNNLPLATFLAPIHLPILAHTSASG